MRHRLYLIGYPLEHTLSPQLQNVYFAKVKLPLTFEAREIAPGCFTSEIKEMFGEDDFLGANVTIPYKQRVVEYLDSLEGDAAELAVVNTVVRRADGRLVGHNTDAEGFANALRCSGYETVRNALVFGTGGAALAVICALGRMGCERFVVVHRSERNLKAVRKLVCAQGKRVRFVALAHMRDFFAWADREDVFRDRAGWGLEEEASRFRGESTVPSVTETVANANSNEFDKGPKQYDLLVNATPLGLYPHAEEAIADHPRFFHLFRTAIDLVYNPGQTRLLFLAQLQGCETISGRVMLEQQAALSRGIWLREFELHAQAE